MLAAARKDWLKPDFYGKLPTFSVSQTQETIKGLQLDFTPRQLGPEDNLNSPRLQQIDLNLSHRPLCNCECSNCAQSNTGKSYRYIHMIFTHR